MYMPTIASCVCIVPTVTTASMVHRGELITTTPIVVIVTIAVQRTHTWPAAASTHLPHQQIQLGCTSHLEIEASTPASISSDTHAMIHFDMPDLAVRSSLLMSFTISFDTHTR